MHIENQKLSFFAKYECDGKIIKVFWLFFYIFFNDLWPLT